MILSGAKAKRLVSNYAILAAVPELQRPVESYRQVQMKTKGKDCAKCDEVALFAGVEKEALDAIIGLSQDAMQRLAGFINEKEILAYTSIPGQKPQYKQIFPPKTK